MLGIGFLTDGFQDSSAPGAGAATITVVSPTPNVPPGSGGGFPPAYDDAKATPIVLQLTDATSAIVLVTITALFLDTPPEPVYRGTSFYAGYIHGSGQSTITNGIQLAIVRDGGWPGASSSSNLAVGLAIDVADASGSVTSQTVYWQLPSAVASTELPPTPAPSVGALDYVAAALDRLCEQFRPGPG